MIQRPPRDLPECPREWVLTKDPRARIFAQENNFLLDQFAKVPLTHQTSIVDGPKLLRVQSMPRIWPTTLYASNPREMVYSPNYEITGIAHYTVLGTPLKTVGNKATNLASPCFPLLSTDEQKQFFHDQRHCANRVGGPQPWAYPITSLVSPVDDDLEATTLAIWYFCHPVMTRHRRESLMHWPEASHIASRKIARSSNPDDGFIRVVIGPEDPLSVEFYQPFTHRGSEFPTRLHAILAEKLYVCLPQFQTLFMAAQELRHHAPTNCIAAMIHVKQLLESNAAVADRQAWRDNKKDIVFDVMWSAIQQCGSYMLQVMDMENKTFQHRSLGPDFVSINDKNEWAVPRNLLGDLTLRLRHRFQNWVRSLRGFYVNPQNYPPSQEVLKVGQLFPPICDEIYRMTKWWVFYQYKVTSTPIGSAPLTGVTQIPSDVFKKPTVRAAPPTLVSASRRKRHTQPKVSLVDLLAKTPKM